jgi:spore maturation protein CgeB
MKIVMFYHSVISDWNHGNAHFLRGLIGALQSRDHEVVVLEPRDGWSRQNLLADHGPQAVTDFHDRFPEIKVHFYEDPWDPVIERNLEGSALVIVHEWSSPELVARVGDLRQGAHYRLLFHDTHHRAVSRPEEMKAYNLKNYDGILAFGQTLAEVYRKRSWADKVWVLHEAADTRHFYPRVGTEKEFDLVWIGNWGDDERRQELSDFLVNPIRENNFVSSIYGVRYPPEIREELSKTRIEYQGWIPNFRVPEVFARARLTVHVPRAPYSRDLRGIPTIRIFEALACGIPLVSAPWEDSENLFESGKDFTVAKNGSEMTAKLRQLIAEPELAHAIAQHGLQTLLSKHTCNHRADELLKICSELKVEGTYAKAG